MSAISSIGQSVHGPFGAKGVGEPPVVGVPAAGASAIADATGQRLTDLPLPGEVLAHALRHAGYNHSPVR